MDPFTKEGVAVRTKRTWLLVASLVSMVLGFVPMIELAVEGILNRAAVLVLALVGYHGVSFGLMHAWNRWWVERNGRVRGDEQGLWLDDALVVARDAIRHGYVQRRDGTTFVRLGRMVRPVDVAVDSDEEGDALLRAMRLDSARSVGQYPMMHGTYRGSWVRAGLFLALWLVSTLGIWPFSRSIDLVMLSLLIWAVVGSLWAANQFVRVAVGADGVRIRRLLPRPRFVPFGALEAVVSDGRDVEIRLRDGGTIELHHPAAKGWKPLLFRDRADEGRMLVERIKAQAEHHRRAGADVRLLARGNRETREWLRDVALASDEHASFRALAVPPDELWRVVEDPSAGTTARAGAAVALRSRLDDEGRARLRVLADACAAPRLRVALQVAASTAEANAIENAFAALEDDEPRSRARA